MQRFWLNGGCEPRRPRNARIFVATRESYITTRALTPPAWWQFEWAVGLGFWLSAVPSFVIYSFDYYFAANEHLRDPVAACLIIAEIFSLVFGTYKLVVLIQRPRKSG